MLNMKILILVINYYLQGVKKVPGPLNINFLCVMFHGKKGPYAKKFVRSFFPLNGHAKKDLTDFSSRSHSS